MSTKTEENVAPKRLFPFLPSCYHASTINNARCAWSWGCGPMIQDRPILHMSETD